MKWKKFSKRSVKKAIMNWYWNDTDTELILNWTGLQFRLVSDHFSLNEVLVQISISSKLKNPVQGHHWCGIWEGTRYIIWNWNLIHTSTIFFCRYYFVNYILHIVFIRTFTLKLVKFGEEELYLAQIIAIFENGT